MGLLAGCDAAEPATTCATDLPDDFPCATAVASQASATCGPIPDEAPTLAATRQDDTVEITVDGLVFREQQTLCAWASLEPPTAALMIQPCDLHPAEPRKSDCRYAVVVTLTEADAITSVHAWRRHDQHGDMPDTTALDLGTIAIE